jgi:hypothetical protein
MTISRSEAQELHECIGTVRADLADQIDSSEFDDEFAGDRELIARLDRALELAAIVVADTIG